jgi:indoleamine 2,3-dioxygenase
MSGVIAELKNLLLAIREGCDPDVFYRDIRPWFKGADSDARKRKWIFEGLEDHPDLQEPTELSGPSAGQSPLVHALDIFLGVDRYSHSSNLTGHSTAFPVDKVAFLTRMQSYMSRHHRNFLRHLSENPRPLRTLVLAAGEPALLEAYNAAVQSLKEFRDAHMIIVALYILGPAKRAREGDQKMKKEPKDATTDVIDAPLRGTGGTNLVRFLKGVRDQTAGALVNSSNDTGNS